MSLEKCKSCGKEVASSAKKCPHCGETLQWGMGKRVVFGVFVVIVGAAVVNSVQKSSDEASSPQAPARMVSSTAALAPARPFWRLDEGTDPMTGKRTQFAELRSLNAMQFGFPYQGDTFAHVMLRRAAGKPIEMMVRIDRGQIICGYSDCAISVRLGDGAPVVYAASKPTDGSSDLVFVQSARTLYGRMQKAKEMHIELTIYKEGNRVFSFDLGNLPKV
jgi:hypothetical protein